MIKGTDNIIEAIEKIAGRSRGPGPGDLVEFDPNFKFSSNIPKGYVKVRLPTGSSGGMPPNMWMHRRDAPKGRKLSGHGFMKLMNSSKASRVRFTDPRKS